MQKLICLAVILSIALTLCACTKTPKIVDENYDSINIFHCGLVAVKVGDLWGYVNNQGELVIEPQFERADEFTSIGYARVRVNGKYGFIDLNGKYICEPKYDYAEDFSEYGLAAVRVGSKMGYINTKGKLVIDAVWGSAGAFDITGYAYVWDGNSYIIDDRGRIVENSEDIVFIGDLWFVNGLAPYRSDEKVGYVNKKGEIVIEPKFDLVSEFKDDGTAWVILDGKWGKIDKSGEFVIEPKFDSVSADTESDLLAAKIDGKWGYINSQCEFVIEPKFDFAYDFYDDRALVKLDEKFNYIDKTGEFVFDTSFDEAWYFSYNGLAPAKVGDLWGYINTSGEIVIEPQFESVSGFAGSIAAVTQNGKIGFINENGEFIVEPEADYIYPYAQDGMRYYEYGIGEFPNRIYGYIREDGVLMDPESTEPVYFRPDGYEIVCIDGKYGVIDFDGNLVVPAVYDAIYSASFLT